MLSAFANRKNRRLTSIFLGGGFLASAAAFAIGVNDNPPGLLLGFLASVALILAFVHPWRTATQFKLLFYWSFLGFVLFALLHNLLPPAADALGNTALIKPAFEALSIVVFFAAIFLCPAGFLVSAVGALACLVHDIHERRAAHEEP